MEKQLGDFKTAGVRPVAISVDQPEISWISARRLAIHSPFSRTRTHPSPANITCSTTLAAHHEVTSHVLLSFWSIRTVSFAGRTSRKTFGYVPGRMKCWRKPEKSTELFSQLLVQRKLVQGKLDELRQVQRCFARKLFDLLTAAETVRDNQSVRSCFSHRG